MRITQNCRNEYRFHTCYNYSTQHLFRNTSWNYLNLEFGCSKLDALGFFLRSSMQLRRNLMLHLLIYASGHSLWTTDYEQLFIHLVLHLGHKFTENLRFPFLTIFIWILSHMGQLISQFHSWLKCWWSHDLKCQQAVSNLLPSTIAHCSSSFISRPPFFAARQQALPLLAPPSLGFFAQTGYCFICAALPLDSNQTTVPVFVSATQFKQSKQAVPFFDSFSLRLSLARSNRQLVSVWPNKTGPSFIYIPHS